MMQLFKQLIKTEINKKPENKKLKKQLIAFFACQEFSRKCGDWTIIPFQPVINNGFFTNNGLFMIKHICAEFLNDNSFICGGAITSLIMGKWFSDVDIFYTSEDAFEAFEKYRKFYHYETKNSITINYKCPSPNNTHLEIFCNIKIQFIKRIYKNLGQILGGFDLDACRLAMDNTGQIFTTHNGLSAIKTERNYINPNCQSTSFAYRIKKYEDKGFTPVYFGLPNKIRFLNNKSDYGSAFATPSKEHLVKHMVFGLRDNYFLYKGPKDFKDYLNPEKMLEATYYEKKDLYEVDIQPIKKILIRKMNKFYGRANHSFWGTDGISVNLGRTGIDIDVKKYMIQKINEEYEHYKNIKSVRITNPDTQASSSFQATKYANHELFKIIYYDLLDKHLLVFFLAAKHNSITFKYKTNKHCNECNAIKKHKIQLKLPKYIIYIIAKFYYQNALKKAIKNITTDRYR